MFDFFSRNKKKRSDFDPAVEITNLGNLNPPSTLVYLPKPGLPDDDPEELGKAFFLRRDKKLYTEGTNLYITSPSNLKGGNTDKSLNNRTVTLQFFSRRVPHRMEVRVLGRFRLLPEIVETLDFSANSAYKIQPTGKIFKQEKRQYFRYTVQNYGETRVPLTTHITFDLYVKITNHQFAKEGAPTLLLSDLSPSPYRETTGQRPFTTRDGINEFRDFMLRKQPHERIIQLTKVVKDQTSGMVKRPDDELLLGDINILGLEMESLRDVLYLKKSQKAELKKGQLNPYNLKPGERVLARFSHDNTHYEMLCEVMEARTQNEVVRPLEYMREEDGLQIGLVDYSPGGILIESSPEFLKLLLGDKCPSNVEEEAEFEGDYWQKAFEALTEPMIHLTFYPHLHFPDAVKQFKPELPSKFSIVAQVARTHVARVGERRILQHGLQFAYDPQGVPMEKDELVDWRYTRYVKDNVHLRLTHAKLSQLIGHLETRARDLQHSSARPR